jgi:3alpha(or 20beta)-hydroxysteroid dehydrogenase
MGAAVLGRLEGKVALITGAAHGQGAAEARLFAAEGAEVVATDVDEAALAVVVEEIVAAGGLAHARHLDVSQTGEWADVVAWVEATCGRLHVLVNNAGVASRRGLLDQSLTSWHRIHDINLWGPVAGMRAVAPLMERTGGGSIVNISSVAGLTSIDAAAYTSSKWGLRGVTKTAANEFAEAGIRVNSVHPGTILTRMIGTPTDEELADFVSVTPISRGGAPEEVAYGVLYLASDESAYVTGTELAIDGGFVSGGVNRALQLRIAATRGASDVR